MASFTRILLLAGTWFQLFALDSKAQRNTVNKVNKHYFVGLQAIRSEYEVLYPTTSSLVGVKPWQIAVGKQVLPNLALQIDYAHNHRVSREEPSYIGTTASGQSTYGNRGSESRQQAVKLAARYSLVRQPHPRLQLDLLAGITFVASNFHVYGSDFVDGKLVQEVNRRDRATQAYATGGLGARYPFGKHFEGVFDYTFSRNLKSAPESLRLAVTGNKLGLTRAYGLGIRYCFTAKRKSAKDAEATGMKQ